MTDQTNEYRFEYSGELNKPTVSLIYEPTGIIAIEEWRESGPDSPLHRVGAPAIIRRDTRAGAVTCVTYYRNGERHRTDGPAHIEYAKAEGAIREVTYYTEGRLDRSDGPAHICYGENGTVTYEAWYKSDKRHRVGGPAGVHWWKGFAPIEEYYQDGLAHREDGPCRISRNNENGIVCEESWCLWGTSYRIGGGPTTRFYNPETGELWREVFQGAETMPTRLQALERRLNFQSHVTFIDLTL